MVEQVALTALSVPECKSLEHTHTHAHTLPFYPIKNEKETFIPYTRTRPTPLLNQERGKVLLICVEGAREDAKGSEKTERSFRLFLVKGLDGPPLRSFGPAERSLLGPKENNVLEG